MAARTPRRRRYWAWPLYAVGAVLCGVVLLLLALQTSMAREQLRARLNPLLATLLQGQIVIDRIGAIAPWGVSGIDARVLDPSGRQVVAARGLSCVVWLPGLARQFVFNSERPEIDLWRVQVDYADITLREDAESGVSLASAFSPRPSTEPETPSPADSGPRLSIREIRFERVWAHGRASGSPPLDADLQQLRASLRQSPVEGLELSLDDVRLVTRAMPLGLDPRGRVAGIIAVPPDESAPVRLEGALDGSAVGSPLSAEVSWVGDQLHGVVELLRLPASWVNERAEGLALAGDVALRAEVEGALPELDYWVEVDALAARARAAGYAVVAEGKELGIEAAISRLDLAALAGGAPPTQLDIQLRALLLEEDDGQFAAAARVEVAPGRVASQPTPSVWLTSAGELDVERGVEAHGRYAADERGLSARGEYELRLPRERPAFVAATLQARLDDPQRLQALGVRGAGTAELSLELYPESGALAAKASLSLSHAEREPIQARNVELRANLAGSLNAPRLHAAATADLLSGRAHVDLDYARGDEQLDVFVTEIDLLRLSNVLGIELPLERGSFELDAHVGRRAPAPDYQLDGRARLDLGRLGAVDVSARSLGVPQQLGELADLGQMKGALEAHGKFDLEALSPILSRAGMPMERTTGTLRFELGALRRADDDQGIELFAQLDSNGLRVVPERAIPDEIETTSEAIASAPRAIEGIDFHAGARFWPRSGEAVSTVILRDAGGTLLSAQGATRLQTLADVSAPQRLPLKLLLDVPQRRLQSLPALLRPAALRGRISAHAELEGVGTQLAGELQVEARSLRSAGSKAPLDVQSHVRYTPADGQAQLTARLSRGQVEVAAASVDWQGDLRRALETPAPATPVIASAHVRLDEMPLDVVPILVDQQLAGRVSGQARLTDWGRDAQLEAELSSSSLVLGQVPVRKLLVRARTAKDQLEAGVEVSVADGSSRAKLEAGMHWGSRPLPELEHRGLAELEARSLRLEALAPLLGAYVSELAGVLDAQARVEVTATDTKLSGGARLAHGVVQVPAIGQRFSEISARVAVADDQFKLERLEARGSTGRVFAQGAARLDGFALRGADAQLTIRKNESLPITLEGVVLGDAWGKVDARFDSPARGERRLDIDVPEFHLQAPETSGHGLQSLEPAEGIRVGVRRADGKFVPLPVQPLEPSRDDSAAAEPAQPLRVTVTLGNNVTVERGRGAQAQLTGKLTVLSADETEVDGRIEVRGGKLDVSGKTFEIERGVVTFQGDDPSNPTITATARWDAPGYTVYAEYVGDVKNGRIKLRSEPPLTQDEIASLLLFGSPEGSVGGGNSSNAALAVSVAGDTAVRGLNQVLDEFTNLDVSARVDTTTGSARPELVFQVSPRVAAKLTRSIGAPVAGESPDRTFLTLELRLRRAWALSALFGDRGASALDLIWRRRY